MEMAAKVALATLSRVAVQPWLMCSSHQSASSDVTEAKTNKASVLGTGMRHQHRATAACPLAWNSVELATLVPPAAFLHRDYGKMVVPTSLGHLIPGSRVKYPYFIANEIYFTDYTIK